MRAVVIMPTYNEQENLRSMVGRLRAAVPDAHLLVVDDDSPDGTGVTADELAASDEAVHVLHRAGKAGLGAAYRAGMRWALDAGYDVVVEMDADGSHQPEQLSRLLDAVGPADVVLGSRWVAGGGTENWPFRRRLLSRGGSTYARIALGVPARDVTGGYRAFTAEALEAIGFEDVASQGYCFQIDMLRRAYGAGLRVTEVPITFVERVHGASKMSGAIVVEAMVRVTGWGITGLPARWRRTPDRASAERPS
ncbi:polyprenol monophosphomannose synthase [Leifsonia shinshuensis]